MLSSLVISAIAISYFVIQSTETIVKTDSKIPPDFKSSLTSTNLSHCVRTRSLPSNKHRYLFSIYKDEQITTNCANQKLHLLKRSCRAHSLLLTIGHTTRIWNSQDFPDLCKHAKSRWILSTIAKVLGRKRVWDFNLFWRGVKQPCKSSAFKSWFQLFFFFFF